MGSFEGVFVQSKLDRTISDINREDFAFGDHKTFLQRSTKSIGGTSWKLEFGLGELELGLG